MVLRLPQGYAFADYVALLDVVWTADEIAQYQRDRQLPRRLEDIGRDDTLVWLSVHDAQNSSGRLPEVGVEQRRLLDTRSSLFLFYMGEDPGTKVIPSEHLNIIPVERMNTVRFEVLPTYLVKHGPIGWWLRPTQEETVRLDSGR